MEVILLEKIANLGNLGDKVTVKAGYGRNYLVPHGKAVAATAEKIAEFEQRRAELEKAAAGDLAKAQVRSEAIGQLSVSIARKAGEGGKLFGSVGTQDIAEAVTAAGVEVKRQEIRLPEGPLRHVDEYQIKIQFHSDVVATLALSVVEEE